MEIYLTKMILNPQSRKVWDDLGNLQNMHRTVSKAFPKIKVNESAPHHLQKTPRNEFNLLHRLDFDSRNGKAVLLVQSSVEPDWSFLQADYAVRIECKTVHEQYANIENGMRLLFRLQANPTKRIGKSDGRADEKYKPSDERKIRRRVELRTDEEKINWLKRKGEDAGFRLTNVRIKEAVENAAVHSSSKQFGRRGRDDKKMTFGSVVFEGVLEVTDVETFRDCMIRGIGSGKAYGFGLLSIAPSTD